MSLCSLLLQTRQVGMVAAESLTEKLQIPGSKLKFEVNLPRVTQKCFVLVVRSSPFLSCWLAGLDWQGSTLGTHVHGLLWNPYSLFLHLVWSNTSTIWNFADSCTHKNRWELKTYIAISCVRTALLATLFSLRVLEMFICMFWVLNLICFCVCNFEFLCTSKIFYGVLTWLFIAADLRIPYIDYLLCLFYWLQIAVIYDAKCDILICSLSGLVWSRWCRTRIAAAQRSTGEASKMVSFEFHAFILQS